MNDHPALRRALEAFSGQPPEAAIGVADVTARAGALRRRRHATVSGVALVAVVVGGAGLVRLNGEPRSEVAAVTTTESPAPSASPPPGSPSPAATVSAASPVPSGTRTVPPPSASASPAPLPPPSNGHGAHGLEVTIDAAPRRTSTATFVTVTVRARDTDGAWNGGDISFGDGQQEVEGQVVASCARQPVSPSPSPHEPKPSDVTKRYDHAYRRAGTFTITVTVRSDRQCTNGRTPVETATASIAVVIAAGANPSNGPAPPRASMSSDGADALRTMVVTYGAGDPDGWLARMVVDWGDGTPPETLDGSEGECEEPGGYWPRSEVGGEMSHDYAEDGSYTVTLTVVSVGCDGRDEQRATMSHDVLVA